MWPFSQRIVVVREDIDARKYKRLVDHYLERGAHHARRADEAEAVAARVPALTRRAAEAEMRVLELALEKADLERRIEELTEGQGGQTND